MPHGQASCGHGIDARRHPCSASRLLLSVPIRTGDVSHRRHSCSKADRCGARPRTIPRELIFVSTRWPNSARFHIRRPVDRHDRRLDPSSMPRASSKDPSTVAGPGAGLLVPAHNSTRSALGPLWRHSKSRHPATCSFIRSRLQTPDAGRHSRTAKFAD